MAITSLQDEITKVVAFDGASVDISALTAPFEFALVVDNLTPKGGTAIFQLQTSVDGFSADIRVEESFSVPPPLSTQVPLGYSRRDFDLPGFRNGVVSAEARLALAYLDAGALTLVKPGTVTPTPSSSGGSLASNTYYYKVTALGNGGETLSSPEASAVVTGPTGSVALAWTAVTGATSYRIYRGIATNTETVYYSSSTNSFTDTGASSTGGTPPTINTTGLPSVSYSAHFKN